MTARKHLPTRRPNQTVDLDFGGQRYAATVGFDRDGALAEVFMKGAKTGSQMDALLDDAAILISLLLQHGVQPSAFAKSMGRVRKGEPTSVIGMLVGLLTTETGILVSAESQCDEQ